VDFGGTVDRSEASALADLQMHWDEAYAIGLDGDIWSARFHGSPDELRAHTSTELRELIRADYAYRTRANSARAYQEIQARREAQARLEPEAELEGEAACSPGGYGAEALAGYQADDEPVPSDDPVPSDEAGSTDEPVHNSHQIRY
jgi:hypothetical protein